MNVPSAQLMLLCSACILIGCKSTDSYFVDHHVKYRRAAAPDAFLGSIGIKRTEGLNLFERKRVPTLQAVVVNATELTTKQAENFSGSVAVGGEYTGFAAGKAGGSLKTSHGVDGTVRITQIKDIKNLVDEMNALENKELREYVFRDNFYRIVIGVVEVVRFEEESKRERSADLVLKTDPKLSTAGSVELKLGAEVAKERSMQYSPGTVIGYKLGRFQWEKVEGDPNFTDPKICDIVFDMSVGISDADAVVGTCVSHEQALEARKTGTTVNPRPR